VVATLVSLSLSLLHDVARRRAAATGRILKNVLFIVVSSFG